MSLDRIIRALDIASSETREEAIKTIIEEILYSYNEPILFDELYQLINDTFHIQPNKEELRESLEVLIATREILFKNSKYELSSENQRKIYEVILKNKEAAKRREANFKLILDEIIKKESINKEDKDKILEIFNHYLYECFLQHGRNGIKLFLPYTKEDEKEQFEVENLVKSALDKFDKKELKSILRILINEFPKRISSDDLIYLEELAQKAESFFSLGLSKETYDEVANAELINCILFVDTNFLYSILDLHIHQENNACKELATLAKEGKIKIKIKYIKPTLSEFQKKRSELRDSIIEEQFTPTQIKAMLASNKLDPFAKHYFEQKLKDSTTPHPSEKVKYAQALLTDKGIEIFNYNFTKLYEDDKYINLKHTEFSDYLRLLNSFREEKGMDIRPDKDPKKIEHDVLLRESILFARGKKAINFRDTKYFGLSLDKTLIKFDNYDIRKSNKGSSVPTIFLPSQLLKKLRKFLPLITDDYRRAFLSAISSSAYDFDKNKSKVVQRTVAYFKKLGFENENLILDCITNDVFLKDFEQNEEGENLQFFVESEINKRLTAVEEEAKVLKLELANKEDKISKAVELKIDKEKEVSILKEESSIKESQIILYKNELSAEKDNKEKLLKEKELELAEKNASNKLLEEKLGQEREKLEQERKEKALVKLELALKNYDEKKTLYCEQNWLNDLISFRKGFKLLIFYFLISLIPPFMGLIGTILIAITKFMDLSKQPKWLVDYIQPLSPYLPLGIFMIVIGIILFVLGTALEKIYSKIIDKASIKEGWQYFKFYRNKDGLKKIKSSEYINKFEADNKKPIIEDFLN